MNAAKAIIYALLFSLVLLVIAPLSLIQANINDFAINQGEAFLKNIGLLTTVGFVSLTVIFLGLSKTRLPLERFLYAILVAICIWNAFLPLSIGKLDGIDKLGIAYQNLGIGLLLGAAAYFSFPKARSIVLAALLAGPLLSASNILIKHINFDAPTEVKILPLSKNLTNISVISFDALQPQYVMQVIDSNPRYRNAFKGFVNYPNTTAVAPFTLLSTLITKTGNIPEANNTLQIIQSRDTFITTALNNAGFDIETYSYFSEGEPDSNNRIPQFAIHDKNTDAHYIEALRASMLRYLPVKAASDKLGYFIETLLPWATKNTNGAPDPHPLAHYKNEVADFDAFVEKTNAAKGPASARLHHYVFSHDPIVLTKDCELRRSNEVDQRATIPEETECAVKKMVAYIEKLKALDVYNNTLLIFASDHGYECPFNIPEEAGAYRINNRWCLSRYTPLLMLKNISADSDLKQDHTQASLLDIASTICKQHIGMNCERFSGRDLLASENARAVNNRPILVGNTDADKRDYSDFHAVNIGRGSSIEEYFQLNKNRVSFSSADLMIERADNADETKKTQNILSPRRRLAAGTYTVQVRYRLQKTLPTASTSLAIQPSTLKQATTIADLPATGSSFGITTFQFTTGRPLPGAQFIVKLNGEAELEVSDISYKNSPVTQLSSIQKLNLNTINGALLEGFGVPEPWGSWTTATQASIRGKLNEARQLKIVSSAFTSEKHKEQSAKVLLNGKEIGLLIHNYPSKAKEVYLYVPPGIIRPDADNTLSFSLKNPVSPLELGISSDRRKLGLRLQSIEFN